MTALGIAMVVAVFVMTLSIAQGFQSTLVASGSPQNAIIMRKGATSENVSAVTRQELPLIQWNDVLLVDEHLARVRFEQRNQVLEQHAFAAAAPPDDHH